MANHLKEIAEKRARYEALKRNMVLNGESILACRCWDYSGYGLNKLQTQLAHMQLVAEKMAEALDDIQRLERSLLAI